jgi:acylphosphatase
VSVVARLRIVVSGRVQGVGFRYFTQSQAAELGLSGFVRNLPNGDVELEAEGESDQLDRLVLALNRGPSMSHVLNVTVSDRPVLNLHSEPFKITY